MEATATTTTATTATAAGERVSTAEADYLDNDPPVRGQNYVCLSFLSPEDAIGRREAFGAARFMAAFSKDASEAVAAAEQAARKCRAAVDDFRKAAAEVAAKAAAEAAKAAAEAAESESPAATGSESAAATGSESAAATGSESTAAEQDSAAAESLEASAAVFAETVSILAAVRDRYAHVFDPAQLPAEYDHFVRDNEQGLAEDFKKTTGFEGCSLRGIKVRGCYESVEEAERRARALRDKDPNFHVYVAEVGCWCPWSPNPDDLSDARYAETELNTMMMKYKENVQERDSVYDRRARVARIDTSVKSDPEAEEEALAAGIERIDTWSQRKLGI